MADYVLNIVVQGDGSGVTDIADQIGAAGQKIESGLSGINPAAEIAIGAFRQIGAVAVNVLGSAVSSIGSFIGESMNLAGEVNQSADDMQASLGLTRDAAVELAGVAEDVWANNWGSSIDDVSNSLITVSQNMAMVGVTSDAALNQATSSALALRDTFGVDVAQSTDAAATLMQQFGLTSQQAFDFIASGMQQGLDRSGDFLDTIGEYSTQFAAGGATADQFFSLLDSGLQGGVLGTDKAADAFKEFRVRIQDGSTATSAGLQQLGIDAAQLGQQMASGQVTAAQAFQMVIGKLNDTDDANVRMQAGVALLGTQFEDLGTAGALALDLTGTKMDDLAGATDSLNAKYQNWGSLWEGFKRQAMDALLPLSEGMLNLANGAMPTVQAGLAAVTGVISGGVDAAMTFASALSGNAEAFNALSPAVQTAVTVLQTIGSVFQDMASQAVAWGANIFNQVAAGMESAAGPIISAISSIGSVIAGLLMPGSPPAFLPELDTWGAGAMTAYMEGWGQGDFSVFNSISDSIKGALDGIAKASGDKGMNVASILLGSQDEIASAVNEVRQFGSVSESTFQSIIAAAGPAGPQISSLVDAYLDLQAATQDVAQAQQELNDITSNYAAQLDPLNAQLKGIQGQKQQIQDQQRLIKLQEEAGSAAAGSAEQQIALLEIQELQTKMSIRGVEQERDVAVDAAKQKLDAAKQEQAQAKARVDQQKAMIDQQNKTNALIADQAKAMASVGGAVKAAGGAMAGAASATKPLADAVQGVNQTLGAARQSISDVRTNLATMGTTIQSVVAPPMEWLKGAITGLMGAAAGIAVVLGAPVVWSALGTALGVVGTALAAVGSAIAFVLSPIGLLLIAAAVLGAAITTNFMGIGTLAQNLMGIFGQFGTVISTAFAAFQSGGLTAAISTFGAGLASIGAQLVAWGVQAGTVLLNIGQAFINWITPLIPAVLTQLATWGAAIVTWIVTQGPILLTQFLAWGAALISWITPYIPIALAALGGLIVAVGGWIVAQVPALLAQFMAWGQALFAWIAPMIPPALAALGGLIGSLLSWAGGQLGALLSAFGAWAAPLIAWIPGAITSFLAEWPAMLSGWLDTFASWAGPLLAQLATLGASIIGWVATQAGPLLAQLAVWGVQFVAWVAPQIPGILLAVAGIATAILVWIAETAVVLGAKVLEWAGAFLNWVQTDVVPKLPGIMDDIKTAINGWISTALSWASDEAAKIGSSIIDGIKKGIKDGVGALTSAVTNAANDALNAAKKALGIASPSKAFAELGGFTMQGMALGVTREAPKAVNAVSGVMQSVIGAATKVAQAGAKSLAGTGAPASAGDMLAGLNDFVAEFLTVAQSFSMKAVRGAQGFADSVGKILAVIGPAVEALGDLRNLAAPTHESVQAFGAALAYVVGEMITVMYGFGGKSIRAAAAFAESVGKILAPIGTAVDAFVKLGELVTPTHGTVDRFRAALQYVLGEMITVTYSFGPKSIAAAATFAESVGKIMGLIGPAIDAFARLPDLVVPSYAAINQFGRVLTLVTRMMEVVAARFQQDSVKAAATFAESAGKILAIIGPGVEGLTKLAEFGGVPLRVFNLFGFALRQAVAVLIAVGVQFKAEVVSAAAVFAEGAGKTVGMIGGASESLTKLKDFVAPTQAALASFGTSLRAALQTLIQVMQGFTADAIAAAGKFGEGAGKAVAFIGAAAEGFAKLKDFVAPSMGAIGSFGLALHATLIMLISVMNGFAADAIAAAGKFGDGAGKAVSFIGNAVGSFIKLAEFTGVGQAAIDAFGAGLRTTLQALIGVAQSFAADAVAAAAAFGEGAGKALSFIGNAVDGFTKLQDMGRIGQDHVNAFSYNIVIVVGQLRQLSRVFTVEALAAVGAFSDAVSKAVAGLGGAADSLGKLADVERLPVDAVNAWSYNVVIVIGQIRQLAKVFSTEALAAAATFSASVSALVADVMKSMDAFATLGDAKRVGGDVLKSFMASAQSLVGQMNSYLPPNALIVGQNTVIGLINGIVSQRGALVTAMVNTVMAAVIAARQTLGIASPSKVFEQIGQYAGAGLQGGMAAMQPAIAATSAGLGISAVNATTSALRPSGGGTTNNNQRNITVNVTVGKDAGSNPYATADAVVTEINRRLGMQGT